MTIPEIAKAMFECADGATMSAKKDGLGNIGGFLALRDGDLAGQLKNALILQGGIPHLRGPGGARPRGPRRGPRGGAPTRPYLAARIGQVARFGEALKANGVPILEPTGGHAVYLDAKGAFPHIPGEAYPAQSLTVALYSEGGVRGVEIGSFMFGKKDAQGSSCPAAMELVRLAVPRRVYTDNHLGYVAEVAGRDRAAAGSASGATGSWRSRPSCRHFTAKLAPLPEGPLEWRAALSLCFVVPGGL